MSEQLTTSDGITLDSPRYGETAQDLMREALDISDDVESTTVGSRREAAIRMGDRLLVMSDGTDDEGQPCPGYAWTAGALLDGEYVDETGAQWADTEAEARAAIAEWVAAI